MIRILVFLGNPGKEYENTLHNAGYMLADRLYPNAVWQNKFHSLFSSNDGMKLMKPLTYMNLSGTAVSEAASFFRIKPEEIMVIHDDIELGKGKAKMQLGGGLGGHKGLRSIKERLGTDRFWRLRIGVGRPERGDVRLYVTHRLREDERADLMIALDKAEILIRTPEKEQEL